MSKTVSKSRSMTAFFWKSMNFLEFHEKHGNWRFLHIERTETLRVVTTDWPGSRFGNDEYFLTLLRQKCSTGHRTGSQSSCSLRKVFPPVVSIKPLFCQFWWKWHFVLVIRAMFSWFFLFFRVFRVLPLFAALRYLGLILPGIKHGFSIKTRILVVFGSSKRVKNHICN